MTLNNNRPGWRRLFQIRLSSLFLLTLLACIFAPAVPQVWEWVIPEPPQQTLPSPYNIDGDDVQYFSPSPNFKLHREAAGMKKFRNEQKLIDVGG
jgi:hypothetical protein